jgi:hypothetical protein
MLGREENTMKDSGAGFGSETASRGWTAFRPIPPQEEIEK